MLLRGFGYRQAEYPVAADKFEKQQNTRSELQRFGPLLSERKPLSAGHRTDFPSRAKPRR